MSGVQNIFKNAAYLLFSNVFIRLLNAVATIFIARYLGTKDYGMLSVALAFSAIVGYFTDLGLTQTFIREATKTNANLPRLMSSFFRIRILFMIITIIGSLIIINLIYKEPLFQHILYTMVIPTVLGTTLMVFSTGYFQVIQQMKYTAILTSVYGILNAGALFTGILLNWTISEIALIYGITSTISGLIGIYIVKRRIGFFHGWDKRILNGLASFTLGGAIIITLPQMGPLILSKVTNLSEVGYFSAAYRIPIVLYAIPGIIATSFYPMLFKYGNDKDLEAHFSLNVLELRFMSSLGIIMSLPFVFNSEWIINFLFGAKWIKCAPALSILSIMIMLQSINFSLADSLTTKGMQIRRLNTTLVALFAGLLSYTFLGAKYGFLGGSISAVIIEIIMFIGFVISNPTGLKLVISGLKTNVIILLFVLGGFYFINDYLHPILSMISAVVCYAIVLFLFDKKLRNYITDVYKKKICLNK